FLTSCTEIFTETTAVQLERKEISTAKVEFLKYPITVFIGIAGPLWGQVFFCFEEDTARRTAGRMMKAPTPPAEFDEESISAIAELGNMITGRALKTFEEMGLDLILTPPTVFRAEGFQCYFSIPTVNIRFTCNFGEVVISVGLIETTDPPTLPIIEKK
ncbi:MAG: chemotaxis protein CheX, partial [Candidatus Omnitrophica bacterium]|nr:chemotaxis protein CheX [Candidatus Omnitrophota bacterium]